METLPFVIFPEQVEELLSLTDISNPDFIAGIYTDAIGKIALRNYLSLRLKGVDHRDAVDIVTFDAINYVKTLKDDSTDCLNKRGGHTADPGDQPDTGAAPGYRKS